jgi:hypothetical protein
MLFSTALRLAAIECLCPTAVIAGDATAPTLAGIHVLDSRRPEIGDLDPSKKYTPVVSIFSGEATSTLRGEAAASNDRSATAVLEFVVELAEAIEAEEGDAYAEAIVNSDQDARIVLDALIAQIRRALEYGPAGSLFRKMRIGSPVKISCEPHVVPELDLRFCRTFVTMEFNAPDDVYSDADGLPEPAATLLASLPDGSYAKARLTALANAFAAIVRTDLTEITIATDPDFEPDPEAAPDPYAGVTAGVTLE